MFPNQKQSFYTLVQKNINLVLINQHMSINKPMPFMTNMIESAGMQIPDKINSLPHDLQDFITNATEGIVYFCMGGTLKITDLALEKKQAIINALKSIKQKIIWKWDDQSVNDVDQSIFYSSKWLPQNDILAHPNIKAYVTHGGLLSTTEAIYHGVPLVGIPIFADQKMNVKKFKELGSAIEVDFNTLTKESLVSGIETILNDSQYQNKAKELSKRFKDRPMTPLQTAKYWVEYVIRHKDNTEFMVSPAMKLSGIEYFNLDVYLTIFLALLILLSIPIFCFRYLYRKTCQRKNYKKKIKKS